MGDSLKEGAVSARQQDAGTGHAPQGVQATWPRFSANAARHQNGRQDAVAQGTQGLRSWSAGELAGLLCEFLKREHASLAACHGQNVESDWIPLARSLAIRLSEAPGMSLATSPLKTRFLLREQIGAWLVHTALDSDTARNVHVALPDNWGSSKVLAYLFRHEIAPMHHVTAAVRSNSVPLAMTETAVVQEQDERRVNG